MVDIGITSYDIHIPRYRLSHKTISAAMGWLNPRTLPGEKAIANHDDDSLTMAVAAGMDCLGGDEQVKIDSVYFASTTPPYQERATIIAAALDIHFTGKQERFRQEVRSFLDEALTPNWVGSARGNQGAAGSFDFSA